MTVTVKIATDTAPCFALRRIVFIGEQNIPEAEEFDAIDDEAVHLLAEADGRPLGTARLFTVGNTGKIGRVCVLQDARGTGAGVALMQAAIAHFRARGDLAAVKLSAQSYAIGFYEKLGFTAYGADYDDCGIPHRDMVLTF